MFFGLELCSFTLLLVSVFSFELDITMHRKDFFERIHFAQIRTYPSCQCLSLTSAIFEQIIRKHGGEFKTQHLFPCVQRFCASPWWAVALGAARSGTAKGSCNSQASFAPIRLSSRKITQQGLLLDMCIEQTVTQTGTVVVSYKDQHKFFKKTAMQNLNITSNLCCLCITQPVSMEIYGKMVDLVPWFTCQTWWFAVRGLEQLLGGHGTGAFWTTELQTLGSPRTSWRHWQMAKCKEHWWRECLQQSLDIDDFAGIGGSFTPINLIYRSILGYCFCKDCQPTDNRAEQSVWVWEAVESGFVIQSRDVIRWDWTLVDPRYGSWVSWVLRGALWGVCVACPVAKVWIWMASRGSKSRHREFSASRPWRMSFASCCWRTWHGRGMTLGRSQRYVPL